MGIKHIPQRTCIACRTIRAKRELIRVVRTPENHIEADATGKKAGRGAYLCRQQDCWELVLNHRGQLEHALKLETPVDIQDLTRLREFAATLPPRSKTDAAKQEKTD
ncbi:MAG: YlxR family protein [Chloroflexi bacterium]|nr:YlxR family protein [Chloroflexota bacterium]